MELIFLMVILKIPIVYLCSVAYYAIKAEPEKDHGEPVPVYVRPRPRPPRPHGGPIRVYARTPRAALARAARIGGR